MFPNNGTFSTDAGASVTRDMAAAQRFFRNALAVAEQAAEQVITDGHDSYPRAVRKILGSNVEHCDNAYLNRRIKQDHRGIKQRYYSRIRFWCFPLGATLLLRFDEVRQYFGPRRQRKPFFSLAR